MKVFKNGLLTWLLLQLAIWPVFFFIMNLTLQKTILDGFAWVLAVTIVDYLYITLAILGIGKLLNNKKFKKIFWIISSIVLIIFGVFIIKSILGYWINTLVDINTISFITSFMSVFILTISSPLTIVFFTSLFATKAIEYNYTSKQLLVFWFATGLATLLFMWISVILFSVIKWTISVWLIKSLNMIVWLLLIWYWAIRLAKVVRKN